MTVERWSRVEQLFDAVLTLPSTVRGAYLERATGDDETLRRQVQDLLRQAETPDALLDRPAAESVQRSGPSSSSLHAGTRVGSWRVAELVGRGGMGEVYRAERADGAFQQQAAIKLIRREAVDQIDRFHEERRLLARLDHPGIARLLDGGLASDGRPYMVMEWVEGVSITQWCRDHAPDLRQRIALFLQVCESVAYAHRNLLVHRDLKPSNVMVTADGRAKLLDFGVAKLLSGTSDETRTHAPMTLAYAAPEQIDQQRITPAADVYALGLLLFELLTGMRPWHRPQMSMAALIEKQLHESAPPPSLAASQIADSPVHSTLLRGDLDAIVGFALRREPERRYRSAAEFADDLRRHLDGQPVLARPESVTYSLTRLVQRNRAAAVFAAIALAALVLGFVVSLWQAHEAQVAAESAQREAARATATKDFLLRVFRASDPRIAQDKPRGQITAKELLDLNAPLIAQEFPDDPETRIELLGMMASIYRELGDETQYRVLHTQQSNVVRKLHGDLHPSIVQGLLDDAHHANNRNAYAEALKFLDQADPLIKRARLDRTATRARWWLIRSDVLTNDESEEVDAQALEHAIKLFREVAPTDPNYVKALTSLGWRTLRRNPAEAEGYFLQAIDVAKDNPEANSGDLQQLTYPGLAQAREDQSKYEAAVEAYDRGAELMQQTYGETHSTAWVPAAQYAWTLHRHGLRERALAQFDKLMKNIPAGWSQDSYDEYAREFYADRLAAEGRALEAVPLLEAALKTYLERPSVEYEVRRNRLILGDAYERAGRFKEAREALKASLDERLMKEPPEGGTVSAARERWGRFLLTQRDFADSEPQFVEVLAQARGRNSEMAALAHGGLSRLALLRRDPNLALSESTHAVVTFENLVGRRDVRSGPYLWLIHSEALRQSDDLASAKVWAERALEASRRYDAPDALSIRQAEAAVTAASD